MDQLANLIIALVLLSKQQPKSDSVNPAPAQPHIICVDPGHGADDSGALNKDLNESEITLQIAYRLKTLLENEQALSFGNNNFKVVMTRTDDTTDPTNSERAQICNQNRAEALVSIHLNYSDDPTLDYTEGLYGAENKDKSFSDSMTQTLSTELNIPNGETTDFESNLMLKAQMPASLQETVFLSSPDEYGFLVSGTRQDQIAKALYDGVNSWFLLQDKAK